MKFLLYCQDKREEVYFKFLFENTFSCQTHLTSYPQDFIAEAQGSNPYQFYFAALETKEGNSDYLKIGNVLSTKPSLFLGQKKESTNIQAVIKKISDILGIGYESDGMLEKFIPVKTDNYLRVDHHNCDVFIKLSEQKYLKIFKNDTALTMDERIRLHKKNIESVYVRTEDFEKFLESINAFPEDYSDLPSEEAFRKISADLSFAQEILHQLSNKIGMNQRTLTYVNQSMRLLYSLIDQNQDLKSMWSTLVKDQGSISEHSLIVACIANGILAQTNFRDESYSMKLSLAALLHDAGLRNEKEYEFELLDNVEEASKKEVETFRSHVLYGIGLLDQIENAPADVDKILLQHHEKYDGSGFPRGLGWSKITFLPAVFIVSHEFVIHLCKFNYSEESLLNFIETKKKEYVEGSFKEVVACLEKIR